MTEKLTIDLGGTKAAYGLVRPEGFSLLAERPVPSSLKHLCDEIRQLLLFFDCEGVAISVAGVIESHQEVRHSPNLPWLDGIPLAGFVQEQFGTSCWLANDMEALGVAELKYGDLRNARCGIVETISTGWGGCTCMRVGDAEVVIPGEPGHTINECDGPICGCGKRGCNEARFSGGAVRRRLGKRFGNHIPEDTDPCAYLDAAADEGATWALEMYEEIGLGIGIAWVNSLNRTSWIEKIIYSGTFAVHAMKFMRKHIERVMADHVMFPHHKTIEIKQSRLWPHGAHIGASMIFEQNEYVRGKSLQGVRASSL